MPEGKPRRSRRPDRRRNAAAGSRPRSRATWRSASAWALVSSVSSSLAAARSAVRRSTPLPRSEDMTAPFPARRRRPGGLPVSIEGSARSIDDRSAVLGRAPPSSSPVSGFLFRLVVGLLLLGRAVAAVGFDDREIDVDGLIVTPGERGEPHGLAD